MRTSRSTRHSKQKAPGSEYDIEGPTQRTDFKAQIDFTKPLKVANRPNVYDDLQNQTCAKLTHGAPNAKRPGAHAPRKNATKPRLVTWFQLEQN